MIDLHTLGLAYRKAKVDLYYSTNAPLFAIADYEKNLQANLSTLLDKINGKDLSWTENRDFLGSWTLSPKSIDAYEESDASKKSRGLIYSSPIEKWRQTVNQLAECDPPKRPKAEFRLMADCSLDFHVLSALWIMQVGHKFDSKLTDSAYGNRLRRPKDEIGINPLSLGSFKPYLKPFRDWRDNGIGALNSALGSGKHIVALTADVSSYYHELRPSFMIDEHFLGNVLGLSLGEEENKLNHLFIRALQSWAASTPLKKGLPVGLPASAIVANMALIELDRFIEQEVVPLYYGRYVDDVLLVMENGAKFTTDSEVWDWLIARSSGKLTRVGDSTISFQPEYLEGTNIFFDNKKNKVFTLAGDSGKALVDSISKQIQERASEWRAMPRLPLSPHEIGTDLLAATQSDGEAADILRKADAMTMRRSGFALKLRDFEAYERDLEPESWKPYRQAFYQAFIDHVLVLPQFFDLEIYLARVIRLATSCEDFEELKRIVQALLNLCDQVKRCELKIKACLQVNVPSEDVIYTIWKRNLRRSIYEAIIAAFPTHLSKIGKQAWQKHMVDWYSGWSVGLEILQDHDYAINSYQNKHAELFSFDLAHMPFRFLGLPKGMVAKRGVPVGEKSFTLCEKVEMLLPNAVIDGSRHLANKIGARGLPNGVLFATRPFNLSELFILFRISAHKDNSDAQILSHVILSTRGFKLGDSPPGFDRHGILQIANEDHRDPFRIVVTSWKTEDSSWRASVVRKPDPDATRYARLCRLLDGVIAHPNQSRYLIMPELALPAHWFVRIARKLQGRGISLISGIEYRHSKRRKVQNQVWAALTHTSLGFPSLFVYMQDKQRPALHEEEDLDQIGGLNLAPSAKWTNPPIIQHGDLRFSILICSELSNISYRAALRGKIDALFVPEWNKDTETFNPLVESAALDLHTFVVQCNNRIYGDSRIRAPYKERWQCDILRVKGGVSDYYVIGEIDVQALRRFQSAHRSPDKPFKPVPDGFEIDPARRVLPD